MTTNGGPGPFLGALPDEVVAPAPAEAPWLKVAYGELGTPEMLAGRANPKISAYFQATGFKAGDAQDAWCSAFANWCMRQAGGRGTGSASARSWLRWGVELAEPRVGCVCVFSRPPSQTNGHVAFYVAHTAEHIHVLGGNQGNAVCVRAYPRSRLLGFRWPST